MTVAVINSVKTLTWAFGELNLRGKLSGESYSVGPKWESGRVGKWGLVPESHNMNQRFIYKPASSTLCT